LSSRWYEFSWPEKKNNTRKVTFYPIKFIKRDTRTHNRSRDKNEAEFRTRPAPESGKDKQQLFIKNASPPFSPPTPVTHTHCPPSSLLTPPPPPPSHFLVLDIVLFTPTLPRFHRPLPPPILFKKFELSLNSRPLSSASISKKSEWKPIF
jgi:hypothetical protein